MAKTMTIKTQFHSSNRLKLKYLYIKVEMGFWFLKEVKKTQIERLAFSKKRASLPLLRLSSRLRGWMVLGHIFVLKWFGKIWKFWRGCRWRAKNYCRKRGWLKIWVSKRTLKVLISWEIHGGLIQESCQAARFKSHFFLFSHSLSQSNIILIWY